MERVGVRELRLNTRELLSRVEKGESLEVTSRGRLVARLVPALRHRTLGQLVEEGLAVAPEDGGDLLDFEPLPPTPGVPLPSQILAEMRADER
ncbi:MAG: type II toxin-antitoxin system Phd/YefM family antitoxin [Candidatus Dormibacteraceae bacterium]